MQEITVEEMLHQGYGNLIDVRSPGEFARDTIPGAFNVPLFSDAERAQVGITYKQEGQAAAQWLGMQLVAPKIEMLMQTIRQRTEEVGEPPVIFCWRGGMRSRAMATFASFSGLPVRRLIGGLRAYRRHVVSVIEPYDLKVPLVLLHGLTGVGKTALLRRLEAKGLPVLDLERMAGHRGSVFGHLAGGRPANQKMFDARLFETLRRYPDAPFFLMEAESRRIGNAVMPAFLENAKSSAIHLMATAPLEVRVERLHEEYVLPYAGLPGYADKVFEAFSSIARRMPTETAKLVRESLASGDYRTAIAGLLTGYYDPRYRNKLASYQGTFTEVDATDLAQAEEQVVQFLQKLGLGRIAHV